jgi:hypothetical protein
VTLPTSKGSQTEAVTIVVPCQDMRTACDALERWVAVAGLQPEQPVFRPIDSSWCCYPAWPRRSAHVSSSAPTRAASPPLSAAPGSAANPNSTPISSRKPSPGSKLVKASGPSPRVTECTTLRLRGWRARRYGAIHGGLLSAALDRVQTGFDIASPRCAPARLRAGLGWRRA